MSDAAVFLWPFFGFLVLAAAAAAWQARNPQEDAAARAKLLPLHSDHHRWRKMPRWADYQAQQSDPARIARSGRRRAWLFASSAAIVLAILLGA